MKKDPKNVLTPAEKQRALTPKNDFIFRMLFGRKGSENIVKDFLEGVLEKKIQKVELGKDTMLLPPTIDEKTGILDVKVLLDDGTKIDIEMQNINSGNIEKRMTYYLSKLYTADFRKGRDYQILNRVIVIAILDFNYFQDLSEHHTVWKMTEQKHKEKTLEEQEIHFIELPKFLKSEIDIKRKLDQWLVFIDHSQEEMVEMAKKENSKVEEANVEYEYLTGDEAIQRIAFLKRKYELDHYSGLSYAKNQGIEIGVKRGRELGLKEGHRLGLKEGQKQGLKEEQLKIAKEMLQKGMEISLIAEITKLSLEEIQSLSKEK